VTPASSAAGGARRLLLVISSLGGGGAERVLSIMANHWAARGVEVTFCTISGTRDDHYALDPRVRRVALDLAGESAGALRGVRANAGRLLALRRAAVASRCDAAISFGDTTNVLTTLALAGTGIPLLVSERADPRFGVMGPARRALRTLMYPRTAGVVVQTPEVRAWAERFVPRARVHVIANPLSPLTEAPASVPEGRPVGPVVFGVGRLVPQKGFDLLIRAFAAVRRTHPAWSLVLLGEGGAREELRRLAVELGVADAVHLPGRVARPVDWLRGGERVFVLSSRFEGFPNALLEAMAAGVASIATDCPSGPANIVRDGVDGLLVPSEDVDALAAALDRLLGDPDLRSRLAARAVEVSDRFGEQTILRRWDELLAAVRAERREVAG
jgi:glycosyltransferase involved in cell wall biosynthesis